MQGIKLIGAVRILFLILIAVLFLISVSSEEVPKSETVIVPGELNDALENAQYFDIQKEYTYGNNNSSVQATQSEKSVSAMAAESVSSFRKTYVAKSGVMVVTLNNDEGSEYSIEVYNSCKQNLCNPRTLSPTQKHCLINVVPDYYYFKVTRISGNGEHILDVDFLNGNNDSAPTAKTCSPPAIIDYSPSRQVSIEMTYYILPKEYFKVTALDKENSTLKISWYENGVFKETGKNYYLFVPKSPGDYKIKAVVENEAYSNEIDWNVNVYEPIIECTQDSDCGEPTLIQDSYCSTNNSVYTKWIKPTCINPKIKIAYCEDKTEEILTETCKNMCYEGSCNPQPVLYCPEQDINSNYLFLWNALDYNTSTVLEFSPDTNFKTKKSINVAKLNSLSVKDYFQTISSYEKSSKENKIYARIVGKNKSGKINYSKTCEFKTAKGALSELTCPTEPITDSYQFTFAKNDSTNPKLQINYTNSFSTGKTLQISPNKTNLISISKYYGTFLNYESKSSNKKLYARISGTDAYKRDTSSNICEFTLKPFTQPTLSCPTQNIDSAYSFGWNAGDFNSTVTLELSYKSDFKSKISITATKLNPTPILKYFKTLQAYAKKNTNGELYARLTTKNKYNQTATSNTCTFKLTSSTVSEKEEDNQYAYFSGIRKRSALRIISEIQTSSIISDNNVISNDANKEEITDLNVEKIDSNNPIDLNTNPKETILSQTTEINEDGDNLVETVIQRTNEYGEIETGVIYQVISNPNNYFLTNGSLIQSTGTSCTYSYTNKKDPCASKWQFYRYSFTNANYPKVIYRFIDCKTGDVLGKGQLCSGGELSPEHYRPEGHEVRVEFDYYQCPNNQCKKEDIDLCSGVTCSNYCWTGDRYYNGSCNTGVCNYTKNTCPNNSCTEGSCEAACPDGCPAYCSGSKLYNDAYCSNSKCVYEGYTTCPNGCSNGACNSETCTEGWKCYSSTKKGYQNEDCSWSDKTTCDYGCENGKCKSQTCSTGWKCMDDETKAYQKSDCSWINDTTCEEGCENGSCNSKSPGDSDYCTEDEQCEAGEGNCSNGNECQPGLYCMPDVGANYGYSSTTNVCEAKEGVGEWKCYNSSTVGFKFYEDGSWTDKTNCPNGCQNGACINSILQGPDNDKDGYSNEDEELAGSDPNNFDSTPFTEFAKYSEEIKEIPKMNTSELITNILVPFLAEKQSFEVNQNNNLLAIKKAIHFSGTPTKLTLSERNTEIVAMGFVMGVVPGAIISAFDFIEFFPSAFWYLLGNISNMNKISEDFSSFLDSITSLNQETLLTIWNGFYKEKFAEGKSITSNSIIISDYDDRQGFAHSYVSGYMFAYILGSVLADKSFSKATDALKLGTAARTTSLLDDYPRLAELTNLGGKVAENITNLAKNYPLSWLEEVAGKTGAKIEEIRHLFKTNKFIAYLDDTQLAHFLDDHARATNIEEIMKKQQNSFFPTGKSININGKITTLPPKMNETDILNLVEDILESGIEPYPSVRSGKINFVYESTINKYGIKRMAVITSSDGKVLTAYPLDGESVLAWSQADGKILQADLITIKVE